MDFSELMQRAASAGNIEVPPSWMQGRTLSGGLATALCYSAVVAQHALPPLRSASVNFIGPSSGNVGVSTKILRKGRSVTFVQADLVSGQGVAARMVFVFGVSRESNLDINQVLRPKYLDVNPEAIQPPSREGLGVAPFSQYFDIRPITGSLAGDNKGVNDNWAWIRHLDKSASDLSALLMIADALPPSALSWLPKGTPASTLSWLANIVINRPETKDGWWLLGNVADQAQSGYSSQNMMIWNRSGLLTVTGRQNVVVFA